MAQYDSVITRRGAALEATSKETGIPIQFTAMAVGDGAGSPIVPSSEMTSLVQERWRGPINDLYVDPDNPDTWVPVTVIPEQAGGFTIREVGLFTAEGIMYAIGNVAETVKPVISDGSAKTVTLRMPVTISPEANVTLLIDPSKVLATREFAERAAQEAVTAHNEDPAAHEGRLAGTVFRDYLINLDDPTGKVDVTLAEIGHPAMPFLFNPVINLLSRLPHYFTVSKRSPEGFSVQVYYPNGTPGVEVGSFVKCGTFRCGSGTRCGQPGSDTWTSKLAVSIPMPPTAQEE